MDKRQTKRERERDRKEEIKSIKIVVRCTRWQEHKDRANLNVQKKKKQTYSYKRVTERKRESFNVQE